MNIELNTFILLKVQVKIFILISKMFTKSFIIIKYFTLNVKFKILHLKCIYKYIMLV